MGRARPAERKYPARSGLTNFPTAFIIKGITSVCVRTVSKKKIFLLLLVFIGVFVFVFIFGNRVNANTVPRVQIPPSPPNCQKCQYLLMFLTILI